MKKISLVIIIICFLPAFLRAQDVTKPSLLTPAAFIEIVKNNHPLAMAAKLEVDKAKALLTASRAGFDPLLNADRSSKTFDGKNYYTYNQSELVLPTWIGADIKAGVEFNEGYSIDPQLTPNRSSYAGIEMPLARGLLMDKRRAQLMQSKIEVNMSKQELRSRINNLLLDAYIAYWNWAAYYELNEVYKNVISNNEQRLRLVKLSFQQGDRPAIDTVEVLAQIQSFYLLQAEAEVNLNNARLELNNFLWINQQPAANSFTVVPVKLNDLQQQQFDADLMTLVNESPVIQNTRLKLESLAVDKRLKFQYLLPYVSVKANVLNTDYNMFKNFAANAFENNNRFGISLKFPLRLSEGRGEYRNAKLKIQQANLELANKTVELMNKATVYFNQAAAVQKQLTIAGKMYEYHNSLLKAEETRFNNGESSLFVINSRELKVIETIQKIIELRMKWVKAYYNIRGSVGMLSE